MSGSPRIYVHGIGLSCPLGRRAKASCAAMVADIRMFEELSYVDDAKRPIVGSRAEFIVARARIVRMLGLLQDALYEVLTRDPLAADAVTLVLALPPGMIDVDISAAQLRAEVTALGRGRLDPSRIWLVVGRAAAGLDAVVLARDLLDRGAPVVMVAAVDSLVSAEPLLELLEQRRLLTDDQPDGVVPGEAAACVLLAKQAQGRRATIEGLGRASEPATLLTDVPLRAAGLREAARAALVEAGCELHDVDVRVSDAAGEGYAFKEQALLVSGLLRRNKPTFPLWLPAATLGDTGTAAGLVGLVVATVGFGPRHKSPGQRAIVLAGSPTGHERAALVCMRE